MTNLTFEKALSELEQLVAKLEKGGLSLNESLALFEKGVKLAKFLRTELDKAERKVEILLKDEKGALRAQAFDLEKNEAETREEGEEADNDDDEEDEDDDQEKEKGGSLF